MLAEIEAPSAERDGRLSGARERTPRILVVDDDRTALMYLLRQVKEIGFETVTAANGQAAWDIVDANPGGVDIVILDREMPVLDGLSLARRLQADQRLRRMPLIMLSDAARTDQVRESIDAGVFYSLTKPLDAILLRSVLNAAVRELQRQRTLDAELRQHRKAFDHIQTCKFRYRTLDEAEALAVFIANCFPSPKRCLPGIAALMINAVEHGSAGIGYDRKTEFVASGQWRAEVKRRLDAAPERTIEVVVARKAAGVYLVITDPGDGFVWRDYLSIDPSRASDNHGRGIAQANMLSFDKLIYNEKGNQVIAMNRLDTSVDDWA